MLSYTEENYLKAIFHLSEGDHKEVSTNELAAALNTRAASVTDMVKRLSRKGLIGYARYKGARTTPRGKTAALQVIRKHRLWETFLVDKLGFHWDEVHDVAEQLEHIQSPLLIERLDAFLDFPSADPHGDPIPDREGKVKIARQVALSEVKSDKVHFIQSVKNSSPSFLQYLDKIGVYIGACVRIVERIEFDGSLELQIDKRKCFISREAAENILVNE